MIPKCVASNVLFEHTRYKILTTELTQIKCSKSISFSEGHNNLFYIDKFLRNSEQTLFCHCNDGGG